MAAKYGPYNYERILGTRNYNLSATVDAFVAETTLRLRALALQASEDLINEVQTPVAKGGKMRVDTGFLRASGQVSLTGMPSGPSRGEKPSSQTTTVHGESVDLAGGKRKIYEWAGHDASATLAGFAVGQTIYFGWTAHYAKYREAYDGFLISGIQNWQTIVNRVCEQIKARSPANRGK